MTLDGFCTQLEQELLKVNCCEDKVRVTESILSRLSGSDFSCGGKWNCQDGCYARHLVFRSDSCGCCVVAMSWGPGQGTPVHDHDGTWCVECCLEGKLEVIQYEVEGTRQNQEETLYQLSERETQQVSRGAVGCLIPPFEHHVIRNPYPERAVTLHVYGKELLKSCCFFPVEGELFRRVERPLGYTPKALA